MATNFSAPVTNPFGLADAGLNAVPVFVDLDGDGDLDALVGNYGGDTLYFQNTGTATNPGFAAAVTNPFGLADVGAFAAADFVDIDADGDLDAFIGRSTGVTRLFVNTGSATAPAFQAQFVNPFGQTNVGLSAAPSFADIDGDNDLDAFIGNSAGNILFLENIGNASAPAFAAGTSNAFGLSDVGNAAKPRFADLDNDGDLDAFSGTDTGNLLFFENTGNATAPAFALVQTNPFGLSTVGLFAAPDLADIDGDGDLDLFAGNVDGNLLFFQNRNPGITLTQSNGSTTVSEGGATDTFTLVLDRQPGSDVTVTFDTTNHQVGTDVPSLTFTAANWDTPQTVTVTAVNDAVAEGAHGGVLRFVVTSGDPAYQGFPLANLAIPITDDDLVAGLTPVFAPALTTAFGLADVGFFAKPALADIDADGDLDVLVGNDTGLLEFFLNTGNASSAAFAPMQTNPFGLAGVGYNAAPSFADIDGDGDLDLFVGERYGKTLFFRNTGSASDPAFAPGETTPFGLPDVGLNAAPHFADIDADGDLDAFIGNHAGATLFFENTGTASSPLFAASQANPFGLTDVGSITTPSFADLDGDGDLDAFIGEKYGSTQYFQNTGSASAPAFATALANPFGLSNTLGSYTAPSFADIDADGDLDAFVGKGLGSIEFFLNGAVTTPPGITLTQGNGSTSVTEGGATDTFTLVLDRQPGSDVTVTFDTTNHQVGLDVPSLTFTAANWDTPQTITVSAVDDTVGEGAHSGLIRYTVGSTDPGYQDFAIAPTRVAIADNDLPAVAMPAFGVAVANPFGLTSVTGKAQPVFVDADADGDFDLVVGDTAGNISLFVNSGSASAPAFASATVLSGLSVGGIIVRPDFGDLDGDGDLDALIGDGIGDLTVFRNVGTASAPSFAGAELNPFGLFNTGRNASPALFDVDQDGDLDAFVGTTAGTTALFLNSGSASAPAFTLAGNDYGFTDAGDIVNPTFADLDGDGDAEAFVGGSDGNLVFLANSGSATLPAFGPQFGLVNLGASAAPVFVDIDADGDFDAFGGNRDGVTVFFRNTGSPTAPAFTVESGSFGLADIGISSKPTFVDLDDDGDLDAFIGNNLGTTTFFLNTGNATVAAFDVGQANPFGLAAVGSWSVPVFADIDNDGDPDAFIGEGTGNTLFFRNTGDASAPAFASESGNFGLGVVGDYAAPTLVDIDADGDFDAFVGDTSGVSVFFLNTGSASSAAFESQPLGAGLPDAGISAKPTFVDLDGDGDLDAFTGNGAGNVVFFRNSGSPTAAAFAAAFGLSNVGYSASPTFADIDADGDLDALVGDATGALVFFRNLATGTTNNAPVPGAPVVLTFTDTRFDDSFQSTNGQIVATDPDNDTLSYGLVGGSDNGNGIVSLTTDYGVVSLHTDTGAFSFVPDDAAIEALAAPTEIAVSVGISDGIETISQSLTLSFVQSGTSETTGDDTLTGTAGNDALASLAGNDVLEGLGGNDSLDGGDGIDTVSYANAAGAISVSLALASAQNTGGAGTDTLFNFENLTGSGFNDILAGNADDNVLVGGAGIDTASYAAANGAVTVSLAITTSQDTLGAGRDTLLGIERLIGSTFNDFLSGNSGANQLTGGNGNDSLNGGAGADTLIGGAGNDTYYIENTGDVVTEGVSAGTDTVFSKRTGYLLAANVENGCVDGAGDLNLTGNTLANALFGGTGKNVLTGGLGADRLTGGAGKDRFDFNVLAESGITAATRDTILDFSRTQKDKIDLTDFDANSAVSGNQAFTKLTSSATAFSATKTFTAAGQLYYDQTADVLYGNIDADKAPEFSIKVLGTTALALADILV